MFKLEKKKKTLENYIFGFLVRDNWINELLYIYFFFEHNISDTVEPISLHTSLQISCL